MADASTLATVASIISGFGVAMLFFRIQRELQMHEKMEPNWIPWADWLLVYATLFSLVLVLLPIVAVPSSVTFTRRIAASACAGALVMVAGYIFGILAPYRLIFGTGRVQADLPHENPEPAEKYIVITAFVVAVGIAGAVFVTAA
jgi:hypothetical protein